MKQPAKRPRGAPKKADPATEVARFRCTPEEKAGYFRKAKKAGKKLSPWLKGLADDA